MNDVGNQMNDLSIRHYLEWVWFFGESLKAKGLASILVYFRLLSLFAFDSWLMSWMGWLAL